MSLTIEFKLSESDLKHFQLIMAQARSAARKHSTEEIIAAARQLLESATAADVPEFVQTQLTHLELLTRMMEDGDWQLPDEEKGRVMNALAYFAEPEDLIPDHIPGLGFLDDAIMVALVTRELRHEIDAYSDFCEFRSEAIAQNDGLKSGSVTREDWLHARRKELQSRMRERRIGRSDGKRSRFSLF